MVLTNNCKSVFVFLVFVCLQSEAIKTLPNFVTPCKITGADLSKCYKENVEKLRPRLVEGIPELQIMGLDPLHVTKMRLSRNDSAAVSYSVIFTNFIVEGGKNFTIEDLKIDLGNPSFKLKLYFPKIVLKGDFVATGVLLGYPLREPAYLLAEFDKVFITSASQGNKVTRKNNSYIDWVCGNFESIFDKYNIQVERLFNNPNQLRLFNTALNENQDLLRPHASPVLENSIGAYITEGLKRVHNLFPLNVLYSEN